MTPRHRQTPRQRHHPLPALAGLALLALGVALISCAAPAAGTASDEEPTMPKTEREYPLTKTAEEWKAELTPQEYKILRQKGTERAFTGEYWDHHGDGVYVCAGCGQPLFDSDTKFESGTGWPSFYEPVDGDHVATETDRSFGMKRTEVLCSRCGGHLGHVFPDGPEPTGLRYCINSAALDFEAEADGKGEGADE